LDRNQGPAHHLQRHSSAGGDFGILCFFLFHYLFGLAFASSFKCRALHQPSIDRHGIVSRHVTRRLAFISLITGRKINNRSSCWLCAALFMLTDHVTWPLLPPMAQTKQKVVHRSAPSFIGQLMGRLSASAIKSVGYRRAGDRVTPCQN
jgi:hypothetical protein